VAKELNEGQGANRYRVQFSPFLLGQRSQDVIHQQGQPLQHKPT